MNFEIPGKKPYCITVVLNEVLQKQVIISHEQKMVEEVMVIMVLHFRET